MANDSTRTQIAAFLDASGIDSYDALLDEYYELLGPLWNAYPNPLDAPEWSIPYADLVGNLLLRLMRLTERCELLGRARTRDVLVPLLAPPGDVRELRQSQRRLTLANTLTALESADALSILTISGYLPPETPRTRTLSFIVRGMADWQRPQVDGAEPQANTTWREPALWLEHELELPYFAELAFPGARSATLADEHRASLLSGRLREKETVWVADWLRSGQYVVDRAGFRALLRGIVRDWKAWRDPAYSGVIGHLRRLREIFPRR